MFERWQRRSRAADARAIEESMRRRLAHQVHDEVGQPLSTLLVRARMVLSAGTADREELTILEGMAERALEATRSLAREVRRGRRNEDDPLHEARAYAEEMLAGTTRLVWVDGRLGPGGPRRALREVAFVIKESINNIARHAHASRVEVRLVNARRGLRVSIADDGVGFAVDRPSAGLGLRANAERMQAVGGRFEVSSRSGLGTVVGLELPR
jgi:two-component system sensor histidine kinase UhpB